MRFVSSIILLFVLKYNSHISVSTADSMIAVMLWAALAWYSVGPYIKKALQLGKTTRSEMASVHIILKNLFIFCLLILSRQACKSRSAYSRILYHTSANKSRRKPCISSAIHCGRYLVKYSACAECEIIHFVNCEISPFGRCEMKFAHIRVSEYFTFAEQIFHSEAISLARKGKFR